ncbi:YeeE/YedE thiosulfate transporter family protein [Helicobacter pametensis]|uniref:YeeE/YedE thiosulfate transporter family protein n=1 Tax=Helicobacter pametensis TaxID=95149 RepID=UPI0004B7B45F|nr:YeeE/YedE thiosulfate transporter family protein [Helicobacter pametensis]
MIAVILGGLFGFVLYLIGATQSKNITNMLNLKDLTLAKIILFGIGFGSLLISITHLLGFFDSSHLGIKSLNLGVVLGGLIFGIGFGIAGLCPGTCIASSGTGNFSKAFFVILGGLVGALFFTLSYGFWENLGLFAQLNFGKIMLFSLSPSYPSVFDLGFEGLGVFGISLMILASILPKHLKYV